MDKISTILQLKIMEYLGNDFVFNYHSLFLSNGIIQKLKIDHNVNLESFTSLQMLIYTSKSFELVIPEIILPKGLISLRTTKNLIYPCNLQYLNCSVSNIRCITNLPNSLVILRCYSTNLITLPTLPPLLEELNCSNCKIIILPQLPKNLRILICSYNKLNFLPKLPNTLEILEYSNNPLQSLFI